MIFGSLVDQLVWFERTRGYVRVSKNIKIVIYEKNFESIKDFDIKQLW